MSLEEADLLADVRARLFAPSGPARTIGAELELIPRHTATLAAPEIETLAAAVRHAAERERWTESGDRAAPSWTFADGGRISFEPGGQIEVSSPPHHSCSELVTSLQRTTAVLRSVAAESEITLHAVGVDPYRDITSVPLQLSSERYVTMTRYLEARSEYGIRMMRQTAALQISVEHGPRPLERWKLLNSLAPYLIAIFANSSVYAGRITEHSSYRAHLWRELDGSRTGLPYDASDPAAAYAEFALNAGALRGERGAGEFHTFRSLLHDSSLTMDDWHFHLSTLFPEIRPKEYFEIRSPDVIAVEDLAVPLAFVAGVVYDDDAAAEAIALLGFPDASLLTAAGRRGLSDERIMSRARRLARISVDGMSRLPLNYLGEEHRAHAKRWLDRRMS